MKEKDHFFEWMSPEEVAADLGISEKEALNQVKARGDLGQRRLDPSGRNPRFRIENAPDRQTISQP